MCIRDRTLHFIFYNMRRFKSNWHYPQSLSEMIMTLCLCKNIGCLHVSLIVFIVCKVIVLPVANLVWMRNMKLYCSEERWPLFAGVANFVRKSHKHVISICSSSDNSRVIVSKLMSNLSTGLSSFNCYFPLSEKSTRYINCLTRSLDFVDSCC